MLFRSTNPLDSMQRSFDLYTRPPLHMATLVQTSKAAEPVLEFKDKATLLHRLELAFWVAKHRVVHNQYVNKSIYKTTPMGGQSRAEGTGGSTPPFLKLFFDQTHDAAKTIIQTLRDTHDDLSEKQTQFIGNTEAWFNRMDAIMGGIQHHGMLLAPAERKES